MSNIDQEVEPIAAPAPVSVSAQVSRRNWIVLTALLAFVIFTIVVTILTFDTQEFRRITQEHEAEQQLFEQQREEYLESLGRDSAPSSQDAGEYQAANSNG